MALRGPGLEVMTLAETNTGVLCPELKALETSRGFLLLLLAGVLLSYQVLVLQRDGICRTLRGETGAAPDMFPLRAGSSALVVGALGYFFAAAQRACAQAEGAVEVRSAQRNELASFLILLAALIRLCDLNAVRRDSSSAANP